MPSWWFSTVLSTVGFLAGFVLCPFFVPPHHSDGETIAHSLIPLDLLKYKKHPAETQNARGDGCARAMRMPDTTVLAGHS